LFRKLLLDGRLNLPANLSIRKISSFGIWWVNTIVGVQVHVGIAIAHSLKHRSKISPPTPIFSIRGRYAPSDRGYIYRSLPRDRRIKERDPNGTILSFGSTVDVGGNDILEVN
jgi:hypothetical protein